MRFQIFGIEGRSIEEEEKRNKLYERYLELCKEINQLIVDYDKKMENITKKLYQLLEYKETSKPLIEEIIVSYEKIIDLKKSFTKIQFDFNDYYTNRNRKYNDINECNRLYEINSDLGKIKRQYLILSKKYNGLVNDYNYITKYYAELEKKLNKNKSFEIELCCKMLELVKDIEKKRFRYDELVKEINKIEGKRESDKLLLKAEMELEGIKEGNSSINKNSKIGEINLDEFGGLIPIKYLKVMEEKAAFFFSEKEYYEKELSIFRNIAKTLSPESPCPFDLIKARKPSC